MEIPPLFLYQRCYSAPPFHLTLLQVCFLGSLDPDHNGVGKICDFVTGRYLGASDYTEGLQMAWSCLLLTVSV